MSDSESEEVTSKPLSSDNLETDVTSEQFVPLESQHEDNSVYIRTNIYIRVYIYIYIYIVGISVHLHRTYHRILPMSV